MEAEACFQTGKGKGGGQGRSPAHPWVVITHIMWAQEQVPQPKVEHPKQAAASGQALLYKPYLQQNWVS